jgi:hypothetical protein
MVANRRDRTLSLPLNPSRCSEDWLRPFVLGSEGHPAWTNVFRVEFQTQGGGRPRRTALTGRPATSARRVHPAAGRILRRLACVAMMEAADHGRLDDPALVEALRQSRLRGVLLQ